MRLEGNRLRAVMITALAALVLVLCGQNAAAQANPPSADAQERKVGDYIVHQSIEVGGRITDLSGSRAGCAAGSSDRDAAGTCPYAGMYDTFVNLQSGPRVLEQSLALRSPGHTGALFDDLYINSFGWGGDPNNVARLRMSKFRAYHLNVTFRRDQNFFDYNLLANPLNPFGTASLGHLVFNSPHNFETRRRMSDVDLVVAPQSVISLRLGFSRNRVEGPSFSSFHMPRGTDIQLLQDNNTTADAYRAGLDFRILPRTTLSYDQFYTHFRGDTSWQEQPFIPFVFGTTPTDLGLSWNIPASQPCAAPFTAGGAVNPACNQGLFMFRTDRYRTNIPTEQLSFQSHYFHKLDLNGRAAYSHSSMGGVYSHFWGGRTGTGRQQRITTNPHNRRTQASATSVPPCTLRIASASLTTFAGSTGGSGV